MGGADKNKGWISIHRSIWDSAIWNIPDPFGKREAWIDLILLVNHEDTEIFFNGAPRSIKRGQYMTSIVALSERWKWDRRKVKRFLEMLKKAGMITVDSTTHGTTISVVNYDKYQRNTGIFKPSANSDGTTDGTADGTTDGTAHGTAHGTADGTTNAQPMVQPMHSRWYTNNNVNNENNENKEKNSPLRGQPDAETDPEEAARVAWCRAHGIDPYKKIDLSREEKQARAEREIREAERKRGLL